MTSKSEDEYFLDPNVSFHAKMFQLAVKWGVIKDISSIERASVSHRKLYPNPCEYPQKACNCIPSIKIDGVNITKELKRLGIERGYI